MNVQVSQVLEKPQFFYNFKKMRQSQKSFILSRLSHFAGASVVQATFTGQEYDDESALQYFGARYLDNGTAKFYSIDPVLIKYNLKYYLLTNPQKLNSYSYGYNNPIYFVDLDGNEGYSWRDIPGVKQLLNYIESHPAQSTNVAVGFTPVAGEFQDAYETISGQEAWTGNDLSTTQRLITSGSFVLPFVGGKIVRKGVDNFISSFKKVDNTRSAFTPLKALDVVSSASKKLDWVSEVTGRNLDEILETGSKSQARFIDNAHEGNINIFIDNHGYAGNDFIRITLDPKADRIISSGFDRYSDIINYIEKGRFKLSE